MQQQTSGHTIKAFDEDIERLRALISQMGGLAEHAIGEAMRCLVQRDVEGAAKVILDDSIFRTLLTHMMENPHTIGQATHLLFVAKNLERVGDHATNIAEMVYYAATGEHMVEPSKNCLLYTSPSPRDS